MLAFDGVGGGPARRPNTLEWESRQFAAAAAEGRNPATVLLARLVALLPRRRPKMRVYTAPNPAAPTPTTTKPHRWRRARTETMTTTIPTEIRLKLASVADEIAAAEQARDAAAARLAALRARIAAADRAESDLNTAAGADDGAGLEALADGHADPGRLHDLVQRATLARKAADIAARAMPDAERQLAEAEQVLADLEQGRKDLRAEAMFAARAVLAQKYDDAIARAVEAAGHLAGHAAAMQQMLGRVVRLPDDIRLARRPAGKNGEYVPPDTLEYIPLHQIADPDLVASSKSSWIEYAGRL